jgi:hypothetical protein
VPAFYVAILGIERSLNQTEHVRVGPQKFWFGSPGISEDRGEEPWSITKGIRS